jgi:hypothetical protein
MGRISQEAITVETVILSPSPVILSALQDPEGQRRISKQGMAGLRVDSAKDLVRNLALAQPASVIPKPRFLAALGMTQFHQCHR